MDRRVSATCHTASLRLTKIVAIHAESFQRFSLLFVPSHGRTRQGIAPSYSHLTVPAQPMAQPSTHQSEGGQRALVRGARCTYRAYVRPTRIHLTSHSRRAARATQP